MSNFLGELFKLISKPEVTKTISQVTKGVDLETA